MNEIKKINPLPFLSTLEANPERDEWIKQREKELAEQVEDMGNISTSDEAD